MRTDSKTMVLIYLRKNKKHQYNKIQDFKISL